VNASVLTSSTASDWLFLLIPKPARFA
jgi:hypothetical protein